LIANLGGLEGKPFLEVPLQEIPIEHIDHRAAFLLTRVDGHLSLTEILDISGMPQIEALRHLNRLRLRTYLGVRE
jgi:hypothetical protein